jgi:hypothetical protein
MQQVDLSKPEVKEVWAKVRDRKNKTNWCLLGFEGQTSRLVVVGSGTGGFREMKTRLSDDAALFGAFQVIGIDKRGAVQAEREKFVAFDFVGGSIPEYSRADFNFAKDKVNRFWGAIAYSASIRGSTLDTFTELFVGRELLRAGGAHKPTAYDFGGGVIVGVSELEEGSGPESDGDFD